MLIYTNPPTIGGDVSVNEQDLDNLLRNSAIQNAFVNFAKVAFKMPDPAIEEKNKTFGFAHFANAVILYDIDKMFKIAMKEKHGAARLLTAIGILERNDILRWNPDIMGYHAYPTLDLAVYGKMKTLVRQSQKTDQSVMENLKSRRGKSQ